MSTDTAQQLDRARRVIAELRKRLDVQSAASGAIAPGAIAPDAIAVVGMACRFPGEARDCESFWRMVSAGRDAIRPIPAHRASDIAAETLGQAALLDDIETFDAAFFDIPPREAAQMDPQQRLFLEVAWEALEDAGQTRRGLAGSQTGIFVGVHNHSGGYLELQSAKAAKLNEYTATGTGHDVIAGRLAYIFDLRGPSLVINTACSSSLVAIHIACQSLRSRDCGMAVAGGVNLILGPVQSRLFGLGGMLAPDGRCKTFDAGANGYGRGEGCGAVVLKRLPDALADRDRVLAVIRGSAINQDGRTNGLTAPNGLSQQTLLRGALARAGLEASRIGYIEAHGTGTALGDPIEVEALAAVYGIASEGAPRCGLGSAKTNINHLEGAAGIAGMIKAILTLQARVMPPVAGFERLNTHLSLEGTRLFVPAEPVEWRSELPRIAAVSAFGWSGVNAHVLLEEAPEGPPPIAARPTVIVVSATDAPGLAMRASALAGALECLPDDALENFAWTATARRSQYGFRFAAAGASRAELIEALRHAGRERQGPCAGTPAISGFLIGRDTAAPEAFGAELMASEEVFRAAVMACAAAFDSIGEPVIAAALMNGFSPVPGPAMTFAFATGVAALLTGWSIRPAAVAGWGVGAIAADYLSGAMTLAEAARRVSRYEEGAVDAAEASARLVRAGISHAVRLDTMLLEGGSAMPCASPRSRLMWIAANLAARGADLAWDAIFAPAARLVTLPAHPFRRRRHWSGPTPRPEAATAAVSAPALSDSARAQSDHLPGIVCGPEPRDLSEGDPAASGPLMECLAKAPAALRRDMVADAIAAEVRSVMELEPEDNLSAGRGFFDLGMNSLMTVDLIARLEDLFGKSLPVTLVMDYPSVTALAGYFESLIAGDGHGPSQRVVHAGASDAAPRRPDTGAPPAVAELSDDEVGDALAAELRMLDLESLE
jgi:acyl transferase domain-containing protein